MSEEVTDTPRWRRRLPVALRILLKFGIAPMLIGSLLGPVGAGPAATLGAVLAVGTAAMNGRRAALAAMPLVALAAGLGSWSKPGWPWVAVVTGFAVLSGLATLRGMGVAASQATLMAVIAPEVADGSRVMVLTGFVMAGSLYGLAMMHRAGASEPRKAPPRTPAFAAIAAIALGTAVGTASSIAVATGWQRATWAVGAVVVLGIPTPGLTEKLMIQRVIGQVGACGIVGGIALVTSNPIVLTGAGLLALVCYLMAIDQRGARPIMWFTAAAMLPAAAATSPDVLIAQRLGFNLLGLAILLVVLAVVRLVTERPARATATTAPAATSAT